ncbi:MAG: hypothetical protein ACRDEA_03390 [Microcystaceae cyanobacterium]
MTQQMFEYTIKGTVKYVEGELYLCSEDGTRLKVKQAPREIDEALKSWQVLPNTSNEGIIASIDVERASECSEESCNLIGRVVVLGKRGKFVQIKVSRTGQKTLKISLSGADKEMKVGQMWKVKGTREGNLLSVSEAEILESEAETDKTSKSAIATKEIVGLKQE